MLLSGCGKDEREGKNNALAGSIATFQSRPVGLLGIMYYKDNGLYIFRLIHIYIYFKILLSYLNAALSAV